MTDPCKAKFADQDNYRRFITLRDTNGQHPGLWFKQDFLAEEKGQTALYLIEEGLSSFLGIDTTKESEKLHFNVISINDDVFLSDVARVNDDVTEYPPPQLISQISANAGISYPQNKQEEYLNFFVELRSYMIDLLRCSFLWIYNTPVAAIMNSDPTYKFNKQLVDDAYVMKIGRPDKEIPIDLDKLGSIEFLKNTTIQDIKKYIDTSANYPEEKGLFWVDNGYNWFDSIPGDPNGETSYDKLKADVDRMAESPYIKNLDGVTLWNSFSVFWLLLHECCHLIYGIPPDTSTDYLTRNLYEIQIVKKVNVIRALHAKPERLPYSYGLLYSEIPSPSEIPLIISPPFDIDKLPVSKIPLIIFTQYDNHSKNQEYCGTLTYKI